MDRKAVEVSSVSLSFSLFLWLSTYLPTYLCTYLSIYRSIYLIYLSLSHLFTYVSIYISIYLSFYLSIYLPIIYIYIYISLSIYLSTYLSIYLSISLPLSLSIYLSVYLSTYLPIYLPIYLSTYLPLSTYLSIYLSASLKNEASLRDFLSLWTWQHQKNAAIQRDFLNFWTWQHQKQSNSARLPQFLHLTTSKTKQFSETSFKNGKLSAELTASYQCVLRFFDSTCLNYCACHEKVIPGHTKCCTCHAKSSQQTWRSDAPNATRRRKSAPGPPNSSDEHVSCTAPATENRKKHLCRSSSNVPRLPSFWEMLQNPHVLLTFDKVHNPMRLPREMTSECPRVVRACGVFHILTSIFASRHNGVHFFNISTSKSGLNLMCFVHFDFEMCFAPQRRALFRHPTSESGPNLMCFVHFDFEMCFAPEPRAIFRHRNFQKWSEPGVLCTFWLGNVLRATMACNFSSLIWPAGSAPAALASLLFDPPEPQIIGNTQCFATFLPFRAPGSSFFWDFLFLIFFLLLFSSLTLPSSAFHLSILSEVWLQNFLRQLSDLTCNSPRSLTSSSRILHGWGGVCQQWSSNALANTCEWSFRELQAVQKHAKTMLRPLTSA